MHQTKVFARVNYYENLMLNSSLGFGIHRIPKHTTVLSWPS